MELVKTYPKLSPFQQALLRGLDEGVLKQGDVDRIIAGGTDLTLTTAERFFRASAREESYRYAVRLIDSILSYWLTNHSGDAVQSVKDASLLQIVRDSVLEFRKLDELPTTSLLPREKAEKGLIEMVTERAKRLRLDTQDTLHALAKEISVRKRCEAEISLAESFIARAGGKIQDFRFEMGSDVCHAQFLAIIYELAVGPYLTRGILKQLARRNRPSLEEAGSRLRKYEVEIPSELQVIYSRLVRSFLDMKNVIAFFEAKASISVFTDREQGGVYYAERSANVF